MHTLSPEQVAELRRLYRAGNHDWDELARPYGVRASLVAHAVGGHGCYADLECSETPVRQAVSNSLPDDKVDEARQLYSTGKYTYEKLAKKFGVSNSVVQNAIRGKGRYGKIGKPLKASFGRWAKNERRAANER